MAKKQPAAEKGIVELYNPANAEALTPEQIEALQNLTNDELKELADAYPNGMMNRNYLHIIDTSKKNPLPALSTFGNLYNLRTKHNLRTYVAYQFVGNNRPKPVNVVGASPQRIVKDLSDVELLTLPGYKTATTVTPATQVEKKVIKKK